MSDHLNDEAVEALLSGHHRDEPLGELLASIADQYATIEPSPLTPELAAFIATGALGGREVTDLIGARRRRKRVAMAALTGTVVGKVMIGVSVAAASVAGMQASGIVEVPMLPGTHHGTVVRIPEQTPDDTPETTPPTSAVPAPVVITVDGRDDSSDEPGADPNPIAANGALPTPIDSAEQRTRHDADDDDLDDDDASNSESVRGRDHDDDDRSDDDDDRSDDDDSRSDDHRSEDAEHSDKNATDSDTDDDGSDHDRSDDSDDSGHGGRDDD